MGNGSFTGNGGNGGGGGQGAGNTGLAGLGGLIAALGGATSDSFAGLETWVSNVVGQLASVIGTMFGRLIGFLSSLRNFLRHLKDTILGHLIRDIWREAMKIKLKLHQVLDPVLATIKRIRAIQQYYFDHLLKPYLDLIQRIRRVLVVFRLLHFRWADALDKYLVEREVQIQKLFLEARRDLNTLADWINFIVDPFHLINHNLFLGSAIRSAKELYAIVFGAQRGSLSPAQAKEQTADAHRFDRQNVIAELHERAQLGLLPGDQEEQLRIKAAFAARGY